MDGPTALKKAQALSSRSFNTSDRRKYFEHLLTLPSYRSPITSAYYAKSITRDFTEFEDLQDQAVDAVLDLCEDEDEQTRISGIQALAEIGRVEPRWVRGNTGVLVQLLECPPGELSHVKKALFALLEVSPSDVFSMMAEDCKSGEDGGSRNNILTFLTIDAESQRREILESGRNVEAEHTFSSGFYDILSNTSSGDTVQVLRLLMGLSTVSGRNATRETMGRFAKTLTNSIRPKESMEAIKLWDEFEGRAENLDPRWTMYFLATHGAAVVQAALDKEDKVAKRILEFTNSHTPSRWRRYLEDREDRDLDAKVLIPRFAQTILEAALNNQSTPNIIILEQVYLTVYTLITLDRTTRDYVPSSLSRRLKDFGEVANRKKRISKGPRVEQCWRNLRDMAEIMADRKERAVDIKTSWTLRVKERSRSPAPVKPREVAPAPSPAPARPAKVDQEVVSRQSDKPSPRAETSQQSVRGVSTTTSRPTEPVPSLPSSMVNTNAIPKATEPPKAPIRVQPTTETPAQGLNIKARAVATAQIPATTTVEPQPAPSPGLSIRARATQTQPPPQSQAQAPSQESSLPTLSTVPPKAQGLSIRSASNPTSTPTHNPRPASLLSRLSSSTNTPITNTTKRPRNDDDDTPNPNSTAADATPVLARRSLADRLGSAGNQPQVTDKRQKIKNDSTIPSPTPSLLSRMAAHAKSNPSSSPAVNQDTSSGFTLKRTGAPTSHLHPPPLPTTQPTSASASGFNIKNRSTSTSTASEGVVIRYPLPESAVSEGLSIKRTQITPTPPNQAAPPTSEEPDDTPIIRKGRGFAAKEYGEVLITPPNPFFPHGNSPGAAGAGQGQGKRQNGWKFGEK